MLRQQLAQQQALHDSLRASAAMLSYKKQHGVLHTFCAAVTPARVLQHYSAESLLANPIEQSSLAAHGLQSEAAAGSLRKVPPTAKLLHTEHAFARFADPMAAFSARRPLTASKKSGAAGGTQATAPTGHKLVRLGKALGFKALCCAVLSGP